MKVILTYYWTIFFFETNQADYIKKKMKAQIEQYNKTEMQQPDIKSLNKHTAPLKHTSNMKS